MDQLKQYCLKQIKIFSNLPLSLLCPGQTKKNRENKKKKSLFTSEQIFEYEKIETNAYIGIGRLYCKVDSIS